MNSITEATLKKSDRGEWVRLFTLTYLRWMAVIGQTFAVVIGYFILKIDFSILICLSLILLSSLLNLLSSFYFPKTKRLSEFQNMLLLLYDLLQLGLMLYFTAAAWARPASTKPVNNGCPSRGDEVNSGWN